MTIAKAIATGMAAGPWGVKKPQRVLYIDGEMPIEESRRRDMTIGCSSDHLLWLHHELYFQRTGQVLNLTNPEAQQELLALILESNIQVLILDNLSCLFSGIKENDADAWELVLPWLLQLRRRKIAVIIVAHAGRNGLMRGTSRREDAAFWVLKLERVEPDEAQFNGLRFTSVFTKNRNALESVCPPLEWTITTQNDGASIVTAKEISGLQQLAVWVSNGLDSATDIALEMHLSKGQVSKMAKKAEARGLIKIEGRRYLPCLPTADPCFGIITGSENSETSCELSFGAA
jgi:AAA domain